MNGSWLLMCIATAQHKIAPTLSQWTNKGTVIGWQRQPPTFPITVPSFSILRSMVRSSGRACSAAARPILLDCVPWLLHIYAMTDPFMWLLRVGEFLHGFGYWSKWCAHARVLLLLAGERTNAPDVERGKRELEDQKHAMSRKIRETIIMRNITHLCVK